MANVKRTRKPGKVLLTLPARFIRAPQKNIPEKILKKLHLRSMVHR